MRHILTMYWNNIDRSIIDNQQAVFNALGYDIRQDEATGRNHGDWLQEQIEAISDDDLVLFMDIDCIPLNASIIERAFQAAERGEIFGAVQCANHLAMKDFIYIAPMFLCFSKRLWIDLGRPSLQHDDDYDAGMRLNHIAELRGISLNKMYPTFCCIPKWALSDEGCYGIATFFQGGIFHLYQARKNQHSLVAFNYVADCLLNQTEIDYLWLYGYLNSPLFRFKYQLKRYWNKPLKWVKKW